MSSKIIWDFLKKEGFSDFGVAGLMGNLDAESALRPNNLQDTYSKEFKLSDAEYTAKVDNGTYTNFVHDEAGYGLAQWTYWSRKENLLNYAKSKKKSIGDLEMQLEFLVKELKTSYTNSVYNILKNATSVQQASDVVLMNFERPANAASKKKERAAMGQVYYDKYAKGVENITMATNTHRKGQKTKLSENFNSSEFDCHGSGCCSETIINPKLVEYVQKIRDHFGKPITITSGYRCPIHNKRVGGATGSRHSKGDAADIVVSGITPREVAKYAESIGIKGIGLYETNADGHFTHIDTRDVKSFWYGQNEAKRTTFGGSTPAPDPSPAPAPKPSVNNNVLSIGDTGENVRKLQEQLVKLGYNVGSKGPDGDFGSKTYAAVIDFQRKHNLDDDGIVGPLTENAIKEAIENMEQNIVTSDIETFKIGEIAQLIPGATYIDGKSIPAWIINSKIYVRSEMQENNSIAFSISKTGPITGVTNISNLMKYIPGENIEINSNFENYVIKVTADVLNIRAGAGTNFKVIGQLRKFDLCTIIAEKNNWGKLKNGTGWICLDYVQKLKKNG